MIVSYSPAFLTQDRPSKIPDIFVDRRLQTPGPRKIILKGGGAERDERA